jgi:prophage DNA circulation protein
MATWRDNLWPATFRDVPFQVERAGLGTGRRVAVHEFPGRDAPVVEDLGRRAREFSLDAYVIGPDYMPGRDQLRAALEQRGPGTLRHPYLGELQVQVDQVRLSESTAEGGMARFSITFRETGPLPAPARATQPALLNAAGATIAEAILSFGRAFNVLAMPADFVAELEADLGEVLFFAELVAGGITADAAALIRSPANLAASITGSLNRLHVLAGTPARAFALYEQGFDVASAGADRPRTTALRRRQGKASDALSALVQTTAIAEAGRTLAGLDYASATQATGLRDALLAAIDARQATADDETHAALADLRVAVVRDVAARGADLARVVAYTPPQTLPALVLAQQLYGDPTRDADLIGRNAHVRHPGFVPGGQALEVLTA